MNSSFAIFDAFRVIILSWAMLDPSSWIPAGGWANEGSSQVVASCYPLEKTVRMVPFLHPLESLRWNGSSGMAGSRQQYRAASRSDAQRYFFCHLRRFVVGKPKRWAQMTFRVDDISVKLRKIDLLIRRFYFMDLWSSSSFLTRKSTRYALLYDFFLDSVLDESLLKLTVHQLSGFEISMIFSKLPWANSTYQPCDFLSTGVFEWVQIKTLWSEDSRKIP